MNTKIFISILALFLIGSCKEIKKEEAPVIAKVEPKNVVQHQACGSDDRVPRCAAELNRKTALNIDLTDNCNFQPIHLQVRQGDLRSTEVVARFVGKNMEEEYKFEKIEFKHLEITDEPNPVVVEKAHVKDSSGTLMVELTLLDLNKCDIKVCKALKERWDKGEIDLTEVTIDADVKVVDKMKMDVKILNEENIYGEFITVLDKDPIDCKNIDINYPRGRHCNAIMRIK